MGKVLSERVCVCGRERERGRGDRVHICSVRLELDSQDIIFQRAILESVSNITL